MPASTFASGTGPPRRRGRSAAPTFTRPRKRQPPAPTSWSRCWPAVAGRVVGLGDAGEGTRLKLVINSWLVILVEGLAETMAFSEAIGVDPERFLETIEGGPTGPAYAQLKGKMMAARKFDPAFSLALARKDARLVLEAAERHGFDAALVDVVAHKMDEAIDAGHGDEDMAATFYASVDGR